MNRFLASFIVGWEWPHLPVMEFLDGPDIATVTKHLAQVLANEGHVRVRYNERGHIVVGDDAAHGVTVIVREYEPYEELIPSQVVERG